MTAHILRRARLLLAIKVSAGRWAGNCCLLCRPATDRLALGQPFCLFARILHSTTQNARKQLQFGEKRVVYGAESDGGKFRRQQ
jgi:hypothetical protein